MFYIYYDEVGKILESVAGYNIKPNDAHLELEDNVWLEAQARGVNTVDLVTFELKYVDYRTDEEKEADRIKALIPNDEVRERTLREMETLNLMVEVGLIQVTYSEPWLKRYATLMAGSVITIDKVPELLRVEVQRRFDHWFD